jgi:organic radical activating enzyme
VTATTTQPRRLRVTEIFESLQGEGASAGAPAIFLRLAGCNLKCAFCDTPYTWDASRFDLSRESRSLSIAEVVETLTRFTAERIVITGGEPLLQQPALEELLRALPERFVIEIETNGTIAPSSTLTFRVSQWNVSPKLGSASLERSERIVEDVLTAFRDTKRAFLKFVVSTEEDVDEALSLVHALSFPRTHVILMPEARTATELSERSPRVAAAALQHGLRFSTRLHVLLWNDERGR